MNEKVIFYRYRVRFARMFPANALSHLEYVKKVRDMIVSARLDFVALKIKRPDIPKLSFGPALAVGWESTCEYADIYLKSFISADDLVKKLSSVATDGFSLINASRIPYYFPKVEALVNIVEYEVKTKFELTSAQVEKFLAGLEIRVEKVKPSGDVIAVDAKPFILSVELRSPDILNIMLKFEPGKTLRPDLLVEKLSGKTDFEILRKQFYWKNSLGKLSTP